MGYLIAGACIFAAGVLLGASISESNMKKFLNMKTDDIDDGSNGPRSI